uniref:Uncharacterized protein n=1 Tax=Globodera rostochiensis TaxID=31243 RepID=A0A914I3H2_GLORO
MEARVSDLNMLGHLRFERAQMLLVWADGTTVPASFDHPMSNDIVQFKELEIKYIDQTVLNFLHYIRRLFNNSIQIWRLVVHNVVGMIVGKEAFDVLRLHISPDVLRTCRKLRIIQITGVSRSFQPAIVPIQQLGRPCQNSFTRD